MVWIHTNLFFFFSPGKALSGGPKSAIWEREKLADLDGPVEKSGPCCRDGVPFRSFCPFRFVGHRVGRSAPVVCHGDARSHGKEATRTARSHPRSPP